MSFLTYVLQVYTNGIATVYIIVNYRGEVLVQFLSKLDTLLLQHARGGDQGMVQEKCDPDGTQ
ncbi:Uncharacterised protein [Streptococcus pneumoniae]|nr:Uncharacterised protein [Streptococcus pneumoniae]CEX92271.1 Uncharacterised protein [Streptococcus pneumoniae]CEY39435.1 Uncharacterised protein [Streptococcus pneumoniae]CEY71756.1 Uncharacterised protein [Streptococcus pneumoniae]CJA49913.1 Uncharacterised protein [Streptococcus pneumoniae]